MLLDHIVHFTKQTPAEVVKTWKDQFFHAAIGGRHERWGTFNALLYMKDCYIEWLTTEHADIAKQANHPLVDLLMHDRQGFGTICLRTDSLKAVEGHLHKEGFETSGIIAAERKTASGGMRKWHMLFVKEPISDDLPSPFFIQWQESDEERYESLREDGTIVPANEKLSIERCVFGVRNVQKSEEKWCKLLGGSLNLPNCQIEFRTTANAKERLEEVKFENGSRPFLFEGAHYYY